MQHLLISWPAKRRSSHSIVMLVVLGVAPSCWNYCSSRCTPRWTQSVLQNLLRTTILTVTVFPTSFSNQNGPIMSCFDIGTHVVHFTECIGLWRTLSGAWDPQNTEFLLLTWTDRETWASSLNHTFWRNSGFSSILLSNQWHISTRFAMPFCLRVCLIWILHGYNWRSFFKILWKDERGRPNSWEHLRCNVFGLPNRISHCVNILWGSGSELSTTCWFLSLFGGLYQCSSVLELLYPVSNLELMGKVIEIKPSVVSHLDSLQWFRLQIEGHTKCFFLYCPCHLLDQMKCYSIFCHPWKIQNNIINTGIVINLQMGHL